ncbi:hypothetical protein SapgrDRAFT_1509 [Saprospira grandis DSM 2844]|uniref:Uncharacterized protein n=1 Tax=Saprospira grandis DSM 2844 TaxID=694433 RepID=J0P6V0_9BACT|nr:hypothetical protein [Saprospira grandis]EJF53222.1 hypothetical protein SapgrDRAFT_1509 [Saprospira grandis DSM 2844]
MNEKIDWAACVDERIKAENITEENFMSSLEKDGIEFIHLSLEEKMLQQANTTKYSNAISIKQGFAEIPTDRFNASLAEEGFILIDKDVESIPLEASTTIYYTEVTTASSNYPSYNKTNAQDSLTTAA